MPQIRIPGRSGEHPARRASVLLALAIASVALWQTEIGSLALYPFTLLATWFHEMGHGLAAMLVGSRFDHLVIFADGSGYALIIRPGDGYGLTSGIIAASGPLGPAVAGSLLVLASRSERSASRAMTVLGVALLVSTLVWVRSIAGWAALPALGFSILAIATYARPSHRRLAVQILGVQACISVWRQFDYLFSEGGMVGGRLQRSDTGAISDALLLPYWFWGASISVVIVAMLGWSLLVSLRR